MFRRRHVRPLSVQQDGRVRVSVSATPDEAAKLQRAAGTMPVSTWLLKVGLRVARASLLAAEVEDEG